MYLTAALLFLLHSGIVCNGCPTGFYGLNCTASCPPGCMNGICDEDGNCTFGCKVGFDAPNCTCNKFCATCSADNRDICTSCKHGFYGPDCDQTCANCSNKSCGMDGKCNQGCKDGFFDNNFTCIECPKQCEACVNASSDVCRSTCQRLRCPDLNVVQLMTYMIPGVVVIVLPAVIICCRFKWMKKKKISKRRQQERSTRTARRLLQNADTGQSNNNPPNGRELSNVADNNTIATSPIRLAPRVHNLDSHNQISCTPEACSDISIYHQPSTGIHQTPSPHQNAAFTVVNKTYISKEPMLNLNTMLYSEVSFSNQRAGQQSKLVFSKNTSMSTFNAPLLPVKTTGYGQNPGYEDENLYDRAFLNSRLRLGNALSMGSCDNDYEYDSTGVVELTRKQRAMLLDKNPSLASENRFKQKTHNHNHFTKRKQDQSANVNAKETEQIRTEYSLARNIVPSSANSCLALLHSNQTNGADGIHTAVAQCKTQTVCVQRDLTSTRSTTQFSSAIHSLVTSSNGNAQIEERSSMAIFSNTNLSGYASDGRLQTPQFSGQLQLQAEDEENIYDDAVSVKLN